MSEIKEWTFFDMLTPGRVVKDGLSPKASWGVYFVDGAVPTILWEDGHSDPVDPATCQCTEIKLKVVPMTYILSDEAFDAWMLHWHEIWQDDDNSVAAERPNQAMLDLIKEIKTGSLG